MSLKITTLIENNLGDNPLLCNEHGLSMYIEVDGVRILFDTGQSGDFIKNVEKLNINLNKLDYVILSHGHYDHSGGFKKLLEKVKSSFKLIVGNSFFDKKYKLIHGGEYKFNGNSFDKAYVKSHGTHIENVSSDVFNINDDIIVFSNFLRSNNFENLNPNFYIKHNDMYELDDFSDEIVLAIKTNRGLFVVLGCAHIGVVNILETISKRINMNIYGIVGGTHLVDADEIRLNKTIAYFKEKNIQLIGVSHCTGENAEKKLKEIFNNSFFNNNTGNSFEVI
ncbi:MBL fold metallo-hydrolase [Tepidibacter aestuarii]|uniref:MBL fold metallo-hydrolase n=1 Tax=Tepidibacter aestuarii TaxID=2925782 RepID=UPI0020C0A816|nr:MBL fold metallo-hydrolase [Tepidibacter aestuarii]CAH2213033.1 7, 8-dihydropterin-6-yl-methyl-4-(beta-D-ribofuranosyl)aminobenzene 5'-phosphate synthase [Tepidibacter aestuarii]